MFGKRRMFKVPQHQKFDYKPMYYDPKKEELEERLRDLRELQKEGIEGTKARIASGMRGSYATDQQYRQRQVRRSNYTWIGVVIMLIVLAYLVLDVYLPELEAFLK